MSCKFILTKFLFLIIPLLIIKCEALSQDKEINCSYFLPLNFDKPTKWKKAEDAKNSEMKSIENDSVAHIIPNGRIHYKLTLKDHLSIITHQCDYSTFNTSKEWVIKNYKESFPCLVELLTDTTYVGISNTALSNKMKNILSVVGGRASYILNELTGESFPTINHHTSLKTALKIQKKWMRWVYNLKTN